MKRYAKSLHGVAPWGAAALALAAAALIVFAAVRAQSPSADPRVQVSPLLAGLFEPVHLTHAGDQSGRMFVVEQAGTIRIIRDGRLLPAPFLDIRSRVISGGELGLLSVAFHPRYASNGRIFVNYTANQGNLRTVIAEYHVSAADPNRADPTERVILEIAQPFTNHNGGLNLFGPDGMLYIGMGDGGSAGDPFNNGQRLEALLGKLLRVDIDGGPPYRVPPDDPFVGRSGARGEIWAYGLRNPWRFAFDRPPGRLFLADVGQNQWEEVDLIERGQNYGWKEVAEPMMRTGLPLVVVQPGITYGPGDGSTVRQTFVQYLQGALRILPKRTAYCWAHVDDIAQGHVLAMEKGGTGQAYVIAGPPHTVIEAFEVAERITGIRAPRMHAGPALLRAAAGLMSLVERIAPVPAPLCLRDPPGDGWRDVPGQQRKGGQGARFTARPLEEGLRETLRYEMRFLEMPPRRGAASKPTRSLELRLGLSEYHAGAGTAIRSYAMWRRSSRRTYQRTHRRIRPSWRCSA